MIRDITNKGIDWYKLEDKELLKFWVGFRTVFDELFNKDPDKLYIKEILEKIKMLNQWTYNSLTKEYLSKENEGIYNLCKEALILKRLLKENKLWNKILELWSWAGLFSKIFWDLWFDVIWLDNSEKMIELAKKEWHKKIKFFKGDFLDYDLWNEKYDLINMLAFIHLFPPIEVPEIFKKIKSHLNIWWLIYLSTTKENQYKAWFKKKSLWSIRYRVNYTAKEFKKLVKENWFKILNYKEVENENEEWKIWMEITAQLKNKDSK